MASKTCFNNVQYCVRNRYESFNNDNDFFHSLTFFKYLVKSAFLFQYTYINSNFVMPLNNLFGYTGCAISRLR